MSDETFNLGLLLNASRVRARENYEQIIIQSQAMGPSEEVIGPIMREMGISQDKIDLTLYQIRRSQRKANRVTNV